MSKVPWRDDGAERDGMWVEAFCASLSMCCLVIERCRPPVDSPPLSWSMRCVGFFNAFVVDLVPGTANADTAKAAAVAWLRMEASRLTKQLLEETEWSDESPVTDFAKSFEDALRGERAKEATWRSERCRLCFTGSERPDPYTDPEPAPPCLPEETDAGILDVVWPDGTRQRLSKEVSRELWRQFHAAPTMTIVLKDEE